jgi:hypothetical protein
MLLAEPTNYLHVSPALEGTQLSAAPLRPLFPRSGRIVGQVSELENIFSDSVSTCILRRAPITSIKHYLAACCPSQAIERTQRVLAQQPDLSQLLRDFPAHGRACVEQELNFLIELFATLTDSRWVGVRIATLHSELCSRFHVDRVGLRLICTWQGPGTEWVEHADVDRRYLGAGSKGIADIRSGLLRGGAQLHRLQPFDVGLFKGERWPGNTGRGAVHRSPALPPIASHRVMVTVDEL